MVFEQYDPYPLANVIFVILVPLIIVGAIFSLIYYLIAKKVAPQSSPKLAAIIGFSVGAVVSGLSAFIYATNGNTTDDLAVLETNLSKKYDLDGLHLELNCENPYACDGVQQPEHETIIINVDGEAKAYTLKQNLETNEPFLHNYYTGELVENVR